MNAAAYAASIGAEPTILATVDWRTSSKVTSDPRSIKAVQGEFLDSVGKWLKRHGQPVAWFGVWEASPKYGLHSHTVLHIAPELRNELLAHMIRAGGFTPLPDARNQPIVFSPRGVYGPYMRTAAQRASALAYILKHASPQAYFDGQPVMATMDFDDRGRGPCTVPGRRSFVSHSIGRAARATAGWHELVTLPELHAVLHPPKRRRLDA